MPTNYIKSLHDSGHGSITELEKKWDEAKDAADESGHKDDYDYITGIFKRMVGVNSSFDLTPRSSQLSATAGLLSWNIFQLSDDFNGFTRLQKVLVRRDTESPDSKRGAVSYWVMSPKDKRVLRWDANVFNGTVYKSTEKTVQDAKYDKLFWSLVGPKLKENEKHRRRYGYIYYQYEGPAVKITDTINTIVLKPDTIFTVYKYGAMWSVRAMNKLGTLVDVDGVKLPAVQNLIRRSNEIPASQPTKMELL